jgi:hypothetical protein
MLRTCGIFSLEHPVVYSRVSEPTRSNDARIMRICAAPEVARNRPIGAAGWEGILLLDRTVYAVGVRTSFAIVIIPIKNRETPFSQCYTND